MAHSKLYQQLLNAREWRELRARKLQANPLCERCEKQGKVVAACVVHHIQEVESGRTEAECRMLAYSWGNLQALCRECHKEIHYDRGTWKRDNHQQRAANRLQQWIAKHDPTGDPPPDEQTRGLDFMPTP